MLNHFRTLLLNLSFFEPWEHIPKGYTAKKLPDDLRMLHDKLFAPKCSRYFRLFLAQNYLNMVRAADMQDYVTAFDNRISYDLLTEDFFKINRSSNPKLSNAAFPLTVRTPLLSAEHSDYYYDSFLISQVDNTNNITIYSRIKGKYLNGVNEYDDPEDSDAWTTLAFSDSTTTCTPVFIGQTGVSFTITKLTSGAFTATSDKTWEFIIEAPYKFDALPIITQLQSIDVFKVLKKYSNELDDLEDIWLTHFNPVYKFAAFLTGFVTVVNTL